MPNMLSTGLVLVWWFEIWAIKSKLSYTSLEIMCASMLATINVLAWVYPSIIEANAPNLRYKSTNCLSRVVSCTPPTNYV